MASPVWWLLHNSMQLHQEQWARRFNWSLDLINSLGPEHCNQTLCSREGSIFHGQDNYVGLDRYLDDCIALYLTFGSHCNIGDDSHVPTTSRILLLREWFPQPYSLHLFGTHGLGSSTTMLTPLKKVLPYFPSMQMYSLMTIICTKTLVQLPGTTDSKISFKMGVLNQSQHLHCHLHHLQDRSDNVAMARMNYFILTPNS
jgi:hypothetical protein